MVEGLFLFFEILGVIIGIHTLYGKKGFISIYTLGFICIEVLYISLANRNIVSKETMPIVYMLFVLYTFLEFKDKLINVIYNCILSILIVSICQMILYIPGIAIYYIVKNEDIMALFINIMVCIIVVLTRRMKIYSILHNICRSKEVRAAISIVLSGGILIYYFYRIKAYNYLPIDVYLTFLLLLIIVIFAILRWQNSNNEIIEKDKEIEITRAYNESYKGLVDNVRQKQHDFKNHLLALSGLFLNVKTNEELIEKQKIYKEELDKDSKYNKILFKINEPILAGFIFHKVLDLEVQGINVYFDINIFSEEISYILINDLVEIIGILIDNAKEAVINSKMGKGIKIILKENDNELIIQISNISKHFTDDEIINFFKRGYSTKGDERGIGLSKIIEYQKKYKFDIMTDSYSEEGENWIKFSIIIKKASVI